MTTKKRDPIIIASTDYEKCLYVIGKAAMLDDELELHYTERYAPTVEFLLRMLRKAFGWLEIDRTTIETMNDKCINNEIGVCTLPENNKLRCSELIRIKCKSYKRKSENKFIVNVVIIEKAGGIRGIR